MLSARIAEVGLTFRATPNQCLHRAERKHRGDIAPLQVGRNITGQQGQELI